MRNQKQRLKKNMCSDHTEKIVRYWVTCEKWLWVAWILEKEHENHILASIEHAFQNETVIANKKLEVIDNLTNKIERTKSYLSDLYSIFVQFFMKNCSNTSSVCKGWLWEREIIFKDYLWEFEKFKTQLSEFRDTTKRLITLNSSYTSSLRDKNSEMEGLICQINGYLANLTSNLKNSNLPCLPLLRSLSYKKDEILNHIAPGLLWNFKKGSLIVKFFKNQDGYFEYMKCTQGELMVKIKMGDIEDTQIVGGLWTKFDVWESDWEFKMEVFSITRGFRRYTKNVRNMIISEVTTSFDSQFKNTRIWESDDI